VNAAWTLRTGRLVMTPVGGADLADLCAIKAAPSVFAVMLGGVRNAAQTADDLAEDVRHWGQYGFGIWAVREAGLKRIVAVARESNFGSRMILGGIGMRESECFTQRGYAMVLYESLAGPWRAR
jgi:RimJ/RimL family protein N-acetyltransferase